MAQSVTDIIRDVARQDRIPPKVALAIAKVESGLNPRSIGDNGTSFGLYQLHIGGELGSHSPQWAFNPRHNAEQALGVVAKVHREHPSWSWGRVAAAAQRPANQPAYAREVDALLGAPMSSFHTTTPRQPVALQGLIPSANVTTKGSSHLDAWIAANIVLVIVVLVAILILSKKK